MIVDEVTALRARPRRRVQIHDAQWRWAAGTSDCIGVCIGVGETPRSLHTTGAGGMPLDKSKFGESAKLWISLGVPALPWTFLANIASFRQPVRNVRWIVMFSPVGVAAAECSP